MKKMLGIIAILIVISLLGSTAFAAEDAKLKPLMDELIKAGEKAIKDVTYNLESKSKKDGKEETMKMSAFFKDTKNFAMDMEAQGQKMKVVITDNDAWMYMAEQKTIVSIPPEAREQFDIEKQYVKKIEEAGEITKAKKAENDVYTIISKEKKKTVITIDPKLGVYTKVIDHDEKGELIAETIFKDHKFGKIDESVFKKPEGVQTVSMPGMPQAEPATSEVKVEEPKKEEAKPTENKEAPKTK